MRRMFYCAAYRIVSVTMGLIWGGHLCHSQNVLLNEVMQSNVDYLMVEKDFPDSWVELYNPSDKDVDIQGFLIGLKPDVSKAYIIPEKCVIGSNSYVLIYCDKENRGLHTDFRIDSGKGDLYLFDKDQNIIDELHLKKMPAPNVSYGRIYDGAEQWHYMITPSAGERNAGNVSNEVLPNPVFSINGGVYDSMVKVTISLPDTNLPDDTKLCITNDGHEPEIDDFIEGRSKTFFINSSTVLRAKLVSSKMLSSRSVTHSYIFHPRTTTLPLLSIVSDSNYFYNEDIGILLGDFKNKGNCYKGWRRPVNAEYYDMKHTGDCLFNQLCETAVSGNYSRTYPQKSLKLYAHKRWGNKRFDGFFWEDKPNVTKVKSFMLRNGGTSCLYGRFNDALIQSIFGRALKSLDWQAYQPVIVYINGRYKGVFEMRERSDEDYVESNYNGKEDIEIQNELAYYKEDIRENTLFKELFDTYTDPNVTYERLEALIDMDNFIDVLATELFSTNFDYPYNNISCWRDINENGKWRWILKDLDYTALRKPNSYNMFKYMFGGGDVDSEEYKDENRDYRMAPSLKLYRVLISFPEFKKTLIDRLSVYIGDFLKPKLTIPVIEEMDEDISTELQHTFSAYEGFSAYYGLYENIEDFDYLSDPIEHYKEAVNRMKSFFNERPEIVYRQLADYFNLGEPIKLTVMGNGNSIAMNNVKMLSGDFEGYTFTNSTITFNCDKDNGWLITVLYSDGTSQEYSYDKSNSMIRITDFMGDNPIDQINVECRSMSTHIHHAHDGKENNGFYIIYNMLGEKLKNAQHGVTIMKNKKAIRKLLTK